MLLLLSMAQESLTILPYVARFDDAVTARGPTATKFVGFRLSEIVYTLWKQSALRSYRSTGHADRLRFQFVRERFLEKCGEKPNAKTIYTESVARDLRLHGITTPVRGITEFGQFLYENPVWCPADRLSFELYHALQRNSTDVPKDSDLQDFNHLRALPYVDAITCDRRMSSYLNEVLKRIMLVDAKLDYRARVFLNLSELLKSIAP